MSENKENYGCVHCEKCGQSFEEKEWKVKCAFLESRLAEQEKRAFEYHAEWESACLRERGRIEDVKDLESRLKEANNEIERMRTFVKAPDVGKLLNEANKENEALQKRLSQAEAERDRLKKNPVFVSEWEHGCDGVCANLKLWVERCPHCGRMHDGSNVKQSLEGK